MQKSHHRGKAFSFQDSGGTSILVYKMSQSVCSLAIRRSGKTKLVPHSWPLFLQLQGHICALHSGPPQIMHGPMFSTKQRVREHVNHEIRCTRQRKDVVSFPQFMGSCLILTQVKKRRNPLTQAFLQFWVKRASVSKYLHLKKNPNTSSFR